MEGGGRGHKLNVWYSFFIDLYLIVVGGQEGEGHEGVEQGRPQVDRPIFSQLIQTWILNMYILRFNEQEFGKFP